MKRLIVLTVVCLLMAACSSGSAEGGSSDFSVLAALGEIPESATVEAAGSLQVSVGNLEAAAAQAGIDLPADSSDPEQLLALLAPLTGFDRSGQPMQLFVPMPRVFLDLSIGRVDEFIAEFGFSPGDPKTFVALESPPAEFVVATGVALAPGLPEVAPGVQTIGQGNDLTINPDDRSPGRPLGRPFRVAQQGDRVAMSRTTDPVVDWLANPDQTLADNPVLSALARRLDEQRVVSAFLVTTATDTVQGSGLGWATDDNGPLGVIVFSYATEGEAQAKLDAVTESFRGNSSTNGQRMSDLLSVDAVEVRGSEVVATLRFPDATQPNVIYNMLVTFDGPFAVA